MALQQPVIVDGQGQPFGHFQGDGQGSGDLASSGGKTGQFGMGVARRARRQLDNERRRRALVDAAGDTLTERALSEATMDAVAQRAKLAKGTLFH
ncbi:MAG: TetR/AcrR family transcriptional regulator [Myxococcales bacterium]|nr:TetR/AcrR family transcriptional regulator [Myxococcales bacterium]MDD9971229.1 TetR/AcrR family transcriptional regulator [Myxococcales bacterium]